MSADFSGRRVLVCGMAKSGISAAILLKKRGADVTVQDLKDADKFADEPAMLANMGIGVCLGKNPGDILAEMDLVVLSPGIPCDLPFVQEANALGVPVIGEIELAYLVCKCPIIGVTGTNGKTTTTALTAEIFRTINDKTEALGNIGVAFTDRVLSLPEDAYAVVELSSFQLETIRSFRPVIASVLNITPDHLNRHKTMDNYVAMKERIFLNQQPEDFLVLNADDAYCMAMREKTAATVVLFSRTRVLDEGVFVDEGVIKSRRNGIEHRIMDVADLQIFGNHNVEDTLAAIAMGLCAHVPPDMIRNVCMSFAGVAHRGELVRELKGIRFYNNSKATNTDAAIKALDAMQQPVILIGGGYDKGAEFGDWVRMFSARVKHFIVLGQVADQIIETCRAYDYAHYDKVNSLKDAVVLAYGKACPGDSVLLAPACASWDMFDNFEQRGDLFKEFVMGLE